MANNDVNQLASELDAAGIKESLGLLTFKGRGLKLSTGTEAASILAEMKDAELVSVLELTGNSFGVEACEAVSECLKSRKELTRALWSDMFTGRLKTEIPAALKSLGNGIMTAGACLVELDLSDNAFGAAGVEGIQALLRSSSCYSLEVLRLNNNGLGIGGAKILASALLDCWKESQSSSNPFRLRVFVAGRNRLENEGAKALAAAFEKLESLVEFSVPQNGIYHEGISALAVALSKNPNMQILNMSDNTFTVKGARSMAKVLRKLSNLEVINFSDCLLKTKGSIEILKTLQGSKHSKLKELVLSGNEIGKGAIPDIFSAIDHKPLLSRVDVGVNSFGRDVTRVQRMAEERRLSDIFASLSDDEGTDDEEEVSGEESEPESAGHETEPECDQVAPPSSEAEQIQAKEASPRIILTDFLASNDPVLASNNILKALEHEIDDPAAVAREFVSVAASLRKEDSDARRSLIYLCADSIVKAAIDAQEANVISLVNMLVTYSGLMKSEQKIDPPANLYGVLNVLNHCAQQSYFPTNCRAVVEFCVKKKTMYL